MRHMWRIYKWVGRLAPVGVQGGHPTSGHGWYHREPGPWGRNCSKFFYVLKSSTPGGERGPLQLLVNLPGAASGQADALGSRRLIGCPV